MGVISWIPIQTNQLFKKLRQMEEMLNTDWLPEQ